MADRQDRPDHPAGAMEPERARGLLNDLLSDLPGVTYRCRNDRDRTMLGLTANVEELTGYAASDLLESSTLAFAQLIDPDDRSRVWETIQEAVEARSTFRVTYRIRTRSGEERWVLEQGRPLEEDGETVLTGYTQDIMGPFADKLSASQRRLEDTRRELVALDLLQRITAVVNRERTLEGAFRAALPEICHALSYPVGHAFVPERTSGEIRSADVWHLAADVDGLERFRAATEDPEWSRREGMPGRVLRTGRVEWVEDVEEDPDFHRVGPSDPSPIRSGVGAPVVSGDETVAVVELYSTRDLDPDPETTDLLTQIGVQLGRVWEREEARRRQERDAEQFRVLTEGLEAGVWLSTPDGESLYRSPAIDDLLFGEREQRQVDDWREFLERVHPDDRDRLEQLFEDPDRAPYEIEYRVRAPDGEVRWLRQRASPIRDEEGETQRIGGLVEDITERRRARQRMAETTRLLRQTLSSIQEAVLVVGRGGEERVIQEVNEAAERIFGYAREELLGTTTEMLHTDRKSSERFAEMGEEALREDGVFRAQFPLRREDGTVFEAEQTVTLLDSEKGLDGGAVSVVRDISEQKEAEERLRRSEERFRQIAEHIDDVFWVTTPEKDVMEYVSPAYEDVWGRPPEDLYEDVRRWLDRIHPDDRERVRRALPGQVEGTYEEEYRIVRPDGEVRWIWDRAFPVENEDGEVHRIVGVAEDVTERRELEEQLRHSQKMEAVGRLAGGIAHDFNNLLTVVRSQSDLLQMDLDDDSDLGDEVDVIRDAADRAADLTSQLLAFSREQVLRPRVVDLNEIVGEMEDLLRRVLGEDVHIETELARALPPVRVDPAQMEHVLMNLAVNARDAMPGGGRLHLSTSVEQMDSGDPVPVPELEPGTRVRLDVADTGMGMDEEIRAQAFDPFFTTKETSGGTGLGLATVYGIVEQSGGSIEVESEPGEGTVFTIRFPASENEVETPYRPAGAVPVSEELTGRVLVIEDDSNVRSVTRRILTRGGLEVRDAGDAESGLEILEEEGDAVDLVLTDLVLPEMGGRELVDLLQRRSPDLPVVVMSGYAEGSPGSREDLPPEIAFIQKPFSPDGLLQIVRENLREG